MKLRKMIFKVLILSLAGIAISGMTMLKRLPVEAAEIMPFDIVIQGEVPPSDQGQSSLLQMSEVLIEDTPSGAQSNNGLGLENSLPIDIPLISDPQISKSNVSGISQNTSSAALESFIQLPMADDYHSQLTETYLPNACGPTSLLMILDYYEIESSLERVIGKLDISPQDGGFDSSCSANAICMSPGAVERTARERYDLQVNAHEGWSFQEIQKALAMGSPIIADIAWHGQTYGPGHFVVIYGIDMEKEKIFYHDPYDGPGMVAKFVDFEASWKGPIDPGDPLQPQGHTNWGMAILQQ